MNFLMQDMPVFVKREMEKLQEVISPLLKKVSKYTVWALPLVSISIINLFFLLFIVPGNRSITTLVIYAALGAIGMALSKEAKHSKKELQKVSTDYIINRIEQSDIVSEDRKDEYRTLVNKQPAKAMNHFIKFLEEENRML